MSNFQNLGLSIQIEDPLVKSSRTSFERLSEQVNSYAHETRAIGGYWSSKMRINSNQKEIEDWIEKGLMRHIVVNNRALETIWEGFVNKITVSLGSLTFSLGPLLNIGNRARVIYSTVDTSTTPPTVGIRTETAVANNTDSQAIYGILEKILSTGGLATADAEQVRDTWLAENAFPQTSRKSNLSSAREPSISLSCLGYWHLFKTYTIANSTSSTQNLSAKIQYIINQQLNSIFSTDFSKITSNTLQVTQYEDKNRKAEAILKELNSKGDSNNNRYNIGIYQNRQMVYEQAPSSIAYQQRITTNEGITDNLSGIVKPWNVLPGKWIFYPDFLVGRNPPMVAASLRTDPRAGYIESVKFTAPWNLSINGEKLGELDQLMAKFGAQGVGA